VTSLATLSRKVLLLQNEIDELMAAEDYLVEEVAEKAVTLNKLLNNPPEDALQSEEYSLFLTEQLNWLSQIISKLSNDKRVIADSILHLQRRKKAQKLYGENK
jgi:glutamate racemase